MSLHFSHCSYFLEVPSEITSAWPIGPSSVVAEEMWPLKKGPSTWYGEERGSSCLLPITEPMDLSSPARDALPALHRASPTDSP